MSSIEIPIKLPTSAPGAAAVLSEFSAVGKALKNDSTAVAQLERQMNRMKKAGKDTGGVYREVAAAHAALSKRVNEGSLAYAKLAVNADKAEKEIKEQTKWANNSAAATKRMAEAAGRVRGSASKAAPAVNRMVGAKPQSGASSLLGMFNLQTAAIGAVTAAAYGAGRAIIGMGKALMGAAEFGENIQFSMTKFLGSSELAKSELKDIRKLSQKLGVSYQDAAKDFQSFYSASGSTEMSKDLIKLKADIATAVPADKVQGGFEMIQKAIAKGKVEAEAMDSVLQNFPINLKQIQKAYAKVTGKTLEQVEAMKNSDYEVQDWVKAIQQASLDASGAKELGATSIEKQFSTINGAFEALKKRAGNIWDDIAGALTGDSGVFKDVLKDLNEWFSSTEYESFVQGVASGISAIGGYIKSMLPVARSFVEGLKKGWAAMLPGLKKAGEAFKKITGSKDGIDGLAKGAAMLGAAVGAMAGAVVTGFAKVAVVIAVLQRVSGAVIAFRDKMYAAGASLIDGLVGGIRSGISKVISAATAVARAAVSTVDSVLDINSPSRVMAKRGAWTTEGFAGGVDDGAGDVKQSVTKMLMAPMGAGTGATSNVSNSSSRSSSNVRIGDIHVHGTSDGQQTAGYIRAQLADLLAGESLVGAT